MKKSTRKALGTYVISTVLLILLSSVAAAEIEVGLSVPVFSQTGAYWSEDQLGTCSTSIGKEGCAITSIAMVFRHYGMDTNPRDMNDWLSNKDGGYSRGCLVDWSLADKKSEGSITWEGNFGRDFAKIKSELNNGYPVIMKFKEVNAEDKVTLFHYAVITGYLGDTFYINDPWGGVQTTVAEAYKLYGYSNPKTAIKELVIYHGPVIQITDQSLSPAVINIGDELTLKYSINNPNTFLEDTTILAAQIKKSGSKDDWIDISGTSVADNKIITLLPGINDYTRKFKIPATVVAGTYDVRWYIINALSGKAIGLKEVKNIVEVKEATAPAKPTITVVSPDTGENWQYGSLHEIRWSYTGNPGDYVDVDILKNGILVTGVGTTIDSGSVEVGVYNSQFTPGEDYQVRITGRENGVLTEYTDTSDGYFAVDGRLIEVAYPNGGEGWYKGGEPEITWKFIRKPVTPVKIELLRGPFYIDPETLACCASKGINGIGSYKWTVPEFQAYGEDYRIRVTSNINPSYTDVSDNYFTIGVDYCSMSATSSTGVSRLSTDPCTPPPLPKLDLVFLIDTTSSMGDDIVAVKAAASEIVEAIDLEGFDSRIAIADYRDYPQLPYGGSTDYVYNLNLPFSSDKDTIISSINGLSLGWGADTPESVYSALVNTMEDPNKDPANSANSGWRNGATKAIIIMGDAPPHQPEPWLGAHTLADVILTSESIDPVIVYSIVIGSDQPTYDAFRDISDGTNGRVYSSPQAADVVAAILEAIGDIGETPENRGVLLNITPALNETTAGNSAGYTVNVTNIGSLSDSYNISLELNNFVGFQRGYPVAIQPSWVNFNSAQITLDPGMSEIRPLEITVPQNWAGMEDVTYGFNVTATSATNASIGNTTSAELKVKADKRSMAEYSKLEIQWLRVMVQSVTIDQGVKNALLVKLANAESKVDTAIANVGNKQFENNLNTAENMMTAFNNQVEAQYDKKVMQPDAAQLEEKANQILEDLEKTKNS